jgi:hypothetical protein
VGAAGRRGRRVALSAAPDSGAGAQSTAWAWSAAGAALLSRVVVFIASYYWTTRHGVLRVDPAVRDVRYAEALHGFAGRLLGPLAHWDGVWFVRIASSGYAHPHSEAFFPLYPLLMRAVAVVTGDYVVAGVAVSLAAYAAAMVLLYRLVRPLYGASVAAWSVAFISWFPTSTVFSAVYSESLFLLLTVASFWLAARRRWWAAGTAGLLAALTRNSGVLLVVPLLLLYGREVGWTWRSVRLRWPRDARLGWLLLVPLGLVLYSVYLEVVVGSWTAFMTAQASWQRRLGDPVGTLVVGFRGAVDAFAGLEHAGEPLSRWLTPGHAGQTIVMFRIAPFAAVVFALVVLVLAVRRLPAGYTAWAFLGLLLPLGYPAAREPLYSLHRFVLVLFPLFVALALLTTRLRPLRWIWLSASAVGLIWFTWIFAAFAHLG